jgi:hypothetical protein
MKIVKLLLATAGATLCVGTLAWSAPARSLSITNRSFRAQFREIRLMMPFSTPSCEMTLEGSLHASTIAKVVGSLIGYITRGRLGPCRSGTATLLTATLPWHMRYREFRGTLPDISSVTIGISDMGLAATENFGIRCLFRTTVIDEIEFVLKSFFSMMTAQLGGAIPTLPECFEADATVSSDEGRLTQLNTETALRGSLI